MIWGQTRNQRFGVVDPVCGQDQGSVWDPGRPRAGPGSRLSESPRVAQPSLALSPPASHPVGSSRLPGLPSQLMEQPGEEASGQKSFAEPSVWCLLKRGLGWGRQAVGCQMPGLMRLQAQPVDPHMLPRERRFGDGEGDPSCLPHVPHRGFW